MPQTWFENQILILLRFMKNFRQRAPDASSDSRDVQEFMRFMEGAFGRHPLWAGGKEHHHTLILP